MVKHSLGEGHLAESPRSSSGQMRQRRLRSPAKVILQTRAAISKHAGRIAKKADEHENLINKVTYSVGVIAFGVFCFLLGARPYEIPVLYALFFVVAIPLRWIYYRSKKWHYFLLDFCYYANCILLCYILFYPRNAKLFLLCFSFSEGPLAWALIVWRCSLVFSSLDKIVSVLIHLMPGTVVFIIRWWDPITFSLHSEDDVGPWPAWPTVEGGIRGRFIWHWMFLLPLAVYSLWQALYWLFVHCLRHQRLLRDPEVMTSFRELSRKASRANNIWWRVSGVMGDDKRFFMYALLQALFTVATMALTVPMFFSYHLHAAFQIVKVGATVWNGGNFFFDVMPRQVKAKEEKRKENTTIALSTDGSVPAQDSQPLREGAELLKMQKAEERITRSTLPCKTCSVHGVRDERAGGTSSAWPQKGVNGGGGSLVESDEEEEVWEEVGEEEVADVLSAHDVIQD